VSGSIVVHGGAGRFVSGPEDDAEAARAGVLAAARAGAAILRAGGAALDAVVAAVVALEDDPVFNAGTGSALNADGEVEMDAALMIGDGARAGAVAGVRTVKNPILLARLGMERTPHVLLAGAGADAFAREQAVPAVAPGSLVTPAARRAWERGAVTTATAPAAEASSTTAKHGTVGAVAFDGAHRLAAATSTGGTARKHAGRIGDSPLIGCGTYDAAGAGAVSCTGLGEAIIRAVLGKSAVDLLTTGAPPMAAAAHAVSLLARLGGDGGLILVDGRGRLGCAFNTDRMARAWVDADGREGVAFGPSAVEAAVSP
jgi:beta-aspartyl-peptidase (threonine type)